MVFFGCMFQAGGYLIPNIVVRFSRWFIFSVNISLNTVPVIYLHTTTTTTTTYLVFILLTPTQIVSRNRQSSRNHRFSSYPPAGSGWHHWLRRTPAKAQHKIPPDCLSPWKLLVSTHSPVILILTQTNQTERTPQAEQSRAEQRRGEQRMKDAVSL